MTDKKKNAAYEFCHTGFCGICENSVEFKAQQHWFRDFLICPNCQSIPRERALMEVIRRYYPRYRKLLIHESSPSGRGVSARLSRECRGYSYSYNFKDVPRGQDDLVHNARSETLEGLTFPDGTFDLFITQDVMEHVLDPASAFREIARVLRPGGAHIFTVPLVRKTEPSRPRARRSKDGTGIEHLLEAQYHGDPVDPDGSLVTMDWGYDITKFIREACGMATHIVYIDDLDAGISAEYIDVVISLKR